MSNMTELEKLIATEKQRAEDLALERDNIEQTLATVPTDAAPLVVAQATITAQLKALKQRITGLQQDYETARKAAALAEYEAHLAEVARLTGQVAAIDSKIQALQQQIHMLNESKAPLREQLQIENGRRSNAYKSLREYWRVGDVELQEIYKKYFR